MLTLHRNQVIMSKKPTLREQIDALEGERTERRGSISTLQARLREREGEITKVRENGDRLINESRTEAEQAKSKLEYAERVIKQLESAVEKEKAFGGKESYARECIEEFSLRVLSKK